jgi:hypothetical protein
MTRVYDKMTATGAFHRLPKELMAYVYLPEYKAELSVLYGIIAEYYNPDHGYAWPSIARLSLDYGKSERTTSEHLRILAKYGLIFKRRTQMGNRYVPLMPLNKDQLYAKYPEAEEALLSAEKRVDQERERHRQRLEIYAVLHKRTEN